MRGSEGEPAVVGGPRLALPASDRGVGAGLAGSPGGQLALLLAVFAVNFLDRQILSVLAPSIQRDLGLTDTQLGLLGGFAFAIFFTALGVPLARLADRGSRRRVLLLSLVAFSVLTALCGAAIGFLTLLAARVGVAVGEAGTNPASHSMIADLYPESRRASAMAVFALGPQIGLCAGFLVGGGLDRAVGWRWAFAGAGAVGLLLALVVARGLAEPRREARRAAPLEAGGGVAAGARRLLGDRVLRHVLVGGGLASAVGYGMLAWLPMLLVRSHGRTTLGAGIVLALVVGVAGGAGTWWGGRLADRWSARDPRWMAGVPALASAVQAPFWLAAFQVAGTTAAVALLVVPGVLIAVFLGPMLALVQNRADTGERALAAAVTIFTTNLIGLGAGPLAIGWGSDRLAASFGPDALRHAMSGLALVSAWAAVHFAIAARRLGAEPR